jgi:hypothetical protein
MAGTWSARTWARSFRPGGRRWLRRSSRWDSPGRGEESRASDAPAETVSIRYDARNRLIAMGVLPQPMPCSARRDPPPFPGALRFAPDPDR